MKKLTVYQKPTCTKCRITLRLLRERGAEFEAINYFETRLTETDLRSLLKKLGLSAREILRKDKPVAKELRMGKKDFSDKELIALMTKHPDLIQRPIVVRGDQAVLGCPPEKRRKAALSSRSDELVRRMSYEWPGLPWVTDRFEVPGG